MTTQAVLFPKEDWSGSMARTWLKRYGYKPIKHAHVTENFIRYRIIEPSIFNSFSTKKLPNGIILVLGHI